MHLFFILLKNVRSFCKLLQIFLAKRKMEMSLCAIHLTINVSLTNDIFVFEQLGPGKLYIIQVRVESGNSVID